MPARKPRGAKSDLVFWYNLYDVLHWASLGKFSRTPDGAVVLTARTWADVFMRVPKKRRGSPHIIRQWARFCARVRREKLGQVVLVHGVGELRIDAQSAQRIVTSVLGEPDPG